MAAGWHVQGSAWTGARQHEEDSGYERIPGSAVDSLRRLPCPPLQHAQGAQRIPAAGRAEAFQLEVGFAPVHVLQRPAAVGPLTALDQADGVGQARVPRRPDGLEIVEGTQNVVVPARRGSKTPENPPGDAPPPLR